VGSIRMSTISVTTVMSAESPRLGLKLKHRDTAGLIVPHPDEWVARHRFDSASVVLCEGEIPQIGVWPLVTIKSDRVMCCDATGRWLLRTYRLDPVVTGDAGVILVELWRGMCFIE